MTAKYARSSCGFCQTNNDSKHRNCPGTIRAARAGKDWTCWCAENGHPAVLPAPPKAAPEKEEEPSATGDGLAASSTGTASKTAGAETAMPGKKEREKAPRCGQPTSKGPCKRKEGHTAGHDAR